MKQLSGLTPGDIVERICYPVSSIDKTKAHRDNFPGGSRSGRKKEGKELIAIGQLLTGILRQWIFVVCTYYLLGFPLILMLI